MYERPWYRLHLPGRFLRAGKQAADHDAVGPRGDRLGDVSGISNAAVGNHGHVGVLEGRRHFRDGRDLGYAHAGDDPRRADRSRPDAHLDRVGTGFGQCVCTFAGGHVACDQRQVRVVRTDLPNPFQDTPGVAHARYR